MADIENEEFDAAFAEFSGGETIAASEEDGPTEEPSDGAEGEGIESDGADDAGADEGEDDDGNGAEDSDEPDEEAGADDAGSNDDGDPWETAPEPLRVQYQALQKEKAELDHRYRSETGRIKSINRNLSLAQRENDELKEKLAALKPGAADKSGAGDDGNAEEAELAALREEYPEIAGPIEKLLNASKRKTEALDVQLRAMDQQNFENHVTQELTLLSEKHSDWQQIATTEEFQEWITQQPKMVTDAFNRNVEAIVDHQEAALIFDVYKATLPKDGQQEPGTSVPKTEPIPKKPSKRDVQRKSAAAPSSRTATAGGDGPTDDFGSAFEFYARKGDER